MKAKPTSKAVPTASSAPEPAARAPGHHRRARCRGCLPLQRRRAREADGKVTVVLPRPRIMQSGEQSGRATALRPKRVARLMRVKDSLAA